MTAQSAHGLVDDFQFWAERIGSSNVGKMGMSGRSELIEAVAERQDNIVEFAAFLRDQKLPLRRYWPDGVFSPPDYEAAELDFQEDSFEWRIFSALAIAAHEIDELKAELSFRSRPQ